MMQHNDVSLIKMIKERGMRITPQRAIILEAVESLRGHITVEDVFQRVQTVNAYISLATVYRTLEMLRDMNLITQTNFGQSQAHFALKDHGSHHHLVCLNCHQLEEFSDDIFDPIRVSLEDSYGFEVYTEHMSLFGICQNCRKAAS